MPPLPSCFSAVKPSLPFFVSCLSVDLGFSWFSFRFSISLLPSKPFFRLDLFLFLSPSFRTEACIKLVQISGRPDLGKLHPRLPFFPLRHCCSKTFITFHMSVALSSFSTLGQYPTTSTFIGVLGSLIDSFLFISKAVKATCSVYISPSAIRISTSQFILFIAVLPFPMTIQPRLLSAAMCRQQICRFNFSLFSVFDKKIGGTSTHLVEQQLLHFHFGLSRISHTVPNPLSTLIHVPSKQSWQCRAWTRPEFWRFV